MTAPYIRTGTEDQVAAQKRRIRTIEANRSQPDAVVFAWAESPESVLSGSTVVSVGGTDPDGIGVYAVGYLTDQLVANCMVHVEPIGGFAAGTGTQYLMALGQSTLYEYLPTFFADVYYPSSYSVVNQMLGVVTAQDATTGLFTNMNARISVLDPLGDGSKFMEFYDPVTGNLWGPAFPYAWAAGDILLSGTFVYTLATSLTDTLGS